MGLTLHIANKNYSSWSYRPWLAMKVAGIDFGEVVKPFEDGGFGDFGGFSPSGLVPVLNDGDLVIWESLAILEYLAEKFPDKGLWPSEAKTRAQARCVSHEMHGGFGALRSVCPMNMRRKPGPLLDRATDLSTVQKNVARIEEIWAECLARSGGPFLFGDFTIADAMYAPVVNRLEVYQLSDTSDAQAYTQAMKALPAWQEWERAARAETWVVEHEEV